MIWCDHCRKKVSGTSDGGRLWCSECGKVLVCDFYSDEPTFVKDSSGQSKISGRNVQSSEKDISAYRQNLYYNAEWDMRQMRNGLEMGDNEEVIDVAMRFYKIAVGQNFTRGRDTQQVRASCLYIACREKRKPYLLIEFSDLLKINVYVLGAVFLPLCEVLRISQHPNHQRPVDPSLFMHRFTESLLGRTDKEVIQTAKRLIMSMKRDWMQPGRKPSGLCGAALYISARSHGYKPSKTDITRTVHVCHATLTARLVEFENTESGSLTMEQFLLKEKELEELSIQRKMAVKVDAANKDVICEHKGCKPFKYQLCENCYDEMITISGGFEGGSDPPAFERAEIERKKKASPEKNADDSGVDTQPCQGLRNNKQPPDFQKALNSKAGSGNERSQFTEPESVGTDTVNTDDNVGAEACDESGNFSDIDDAEVDNYLLNEEETRNKTIIWEELNGKEEQVAKAELSEAAKKRKERRLARAAESSNSTPPQTAAESTYQYLTKKRLGSKINFDAIEDLFEVSESPGNSKKKRENKEVESVAYENDNLGGEYKYGDDGYENVDLGLGNGDEDEEGGISVFDYDNMDEEYIDEDYG